MPAEPPGKPFPVLVNKISHHHSFFFLFNLFEYLEISPSFFFTIKNKFGENLALATSFEKYTYIDYKRQLILHVGGNAK